MPTAPSFIPTDFDARSWASIEPLIASLLAREIISADDYERWLLDRSDLDAACNETRAELFIATSCNTDDQGIADAYTAFIEDISPKLDMAGFELDKRQVELSEKFALNPDRYLVLDRSKRAGVELFREENVALHTELAKLSQEFGKITGAQVVQFDGEERTLPQMQRYLMQTDRAVRESAWMGVQNRRLADRQALSDLLDEMVVRRDRVAKNAGCADYVEYAFKEKQRFDYTPADCHAFWQAAKTQIVPLIRRLDEQRKRSLGVAELRPWDLLVDIKGRPGLKPFAGGKELLAKTQVVMDTLDPRLGRLLKRMTDGAHTSSDGTVRTHFLDLDSRKGKRPGGYQYVRDYSRKPFIFMNAAGLHRDAMTMVHEVGHAFHSMLAEGEPLVEYRHSPIEFAEVASMSMEHLTMDVWGVKGGFYENAEDLKRARREHLEDSISVLAWVAMIDGFQHWMYQHPDHTQAERDAYWLTLDDQFGHAMSWRGLEAARASYWQKQGHLFSHPLYYIEYGIAQLGALGLWLKGKTEGKQAAVDAYIRALSLGGSRPLPDLFAAAGLNFEFGEKAVARIVDAVEAELKVLQ